MSLCLVGKSMVCTSWNGQTTYLIQSCSSVKNVHLNSTTALLFSQLKQGMKEAFT